MSNRNDKKCNGRDYDETEHCVLCCMKSKDCPAGKKEVKRNE